MADEALSCFTSLLESIPGWIAHLEGILKSANERQLEFQSADIPLEINDTITRSKSKHSSTKSKRSEEGRSTKEHDTLGRELGQIAHINALRMTQRKRKTFSEISGDQSGPPKFRTRRSGPIYYDGTVQKSFEQLVRGVGASRNTVRKGKLSARVDALSRAGSSSSDGSSDSDECSPMSASLQYKSTRHGPRLGNAFARDDGFAAFDKIDSRLEKAQALCERAAHQILRDGSCIQEVTSAKEQFTEALSMVESEIPPLRQRVEKAAEKRKRNEERRQVNEEIEEKSRMSEASYGLNNVHDIVVPAFPSEGSLEVDELEVDDDQDDDSDDETPGLNINAITLGKYTQYRNVRMSTRAHC